MYSSGVELKSRMFSMRSKIKKIYFDMDGVLADFDRYIQENHGIDSSVSDTIKEVTKILQEDIVRKNIFLSLNPMEDFQEMFRLIKSLQLNYDVEILTAIGKIDSDHVHLQKKQWLTKHGLGELKVNTVHESYKKGLYGNEYSLLIDDREKCVVPFRENGGIGILHKGFFSTYDEIQFYVVI